MYQHYISQFILKHFAYTSAISRKFIQDGIVHVYDVATGKFRLGEVARTCGAQDLYYNVADKGDPMRIEHLFSKLESKVSVIANKVRAAAAAAVDGIEHVDILEKDIQALFKFMALSLRRSEHDRDEMQNPRRENDFLFQSLFKAARKRGRSDDPKQFWLEQLLYLLETSHEDILRDAEKPDENATADTYKHFIEHYALQIWKAADGYEFFLNESLVDFEGDTESRLGVKMDEERPQLIWMTNKDIIHLILPISPQVAIVFCDESRCWESPFADAMHKAKIPYPENSLLKNAPHKDIVNVDAPSRKRGRKTWPATVAWRVNIGTLSRAQHRVIASYSLSHAKLLIVVQHRAQFERAKRELEVFSAERMNHWQSIGVRFETQRAHQHELPHKNAPLSMREKVEAGLVEDYMLAVDEVVRMTTVTHEVPPRTKINAFKFWLARCALEHLSGKATFAPESNNGPPCIRIMHPALKLAFESAYPAKHADHRDLNNVDFWSFFQEYIGEETFTRLSGEIEKKISELVSTAAFTGHFEAAREKMQLPASSPLLQSDAGGDGDGDRGAQDTEEALLKSPSFRAFHNVAEVFDILKWMFEERQDILATFVRQISVPAESTRPQVVRLRARRV